MANTVGQVSINLRLSLAQFQNDVKQGNQTATREIRGMASDIKESSHEAAGSLALIGDEIGITIPRHLRTFVAGLPGVGQALSAAFDSVAVVALLGVLVELIGKVREYYNALGELSEEQKRFFEDATAGAEKQLEFQRKLIQGAQDFAVAQAKGLDKDTARVANAEQQAALYTQMAGKQVADLSRLQSQLAIEKQIMATKEAEVALEGDNPSALALAEYTAAQKRAEGLQKAINDLQQKMKLTGSEALSAQAKIVDSENTLSDAGKKAEERLNSLQVKLREIGAAVLNFLQNAHAPDDLAAYAANPAIASGLETQAKWLQEQLSTLQQMVALPPTSTPLYGGTAEAMDLAKLQSSLNQRLQTAQEVYTQTRTAAEQYANTEQRLKILLDSNAISVDTYNRALDAARQHMDADRKAFTQFGEEVGRSLIQVAEFGGSWTDALRSIGVELAQLIIKLTLMNALKAESSQGGITGGLADIVIGLSGGGKKATGGPVDQNHWYTVGERGPETFVPRTAGVIVPNSGSNSGSNSRNVAVHNNVTIVAPDPGSWKPTQKQLSARMFQDAQAAYAKFRR